MEMWIVWLIIMVGLLITEVLTQMMWALCLGAGCLVGLILSLIDVSILWQIGATAGGSVIAYISLLPMFRKWHMIQVDKKGKSSRTGMDALLGRRAVLIDEIRPDRLGRARIDGDNWQVRCPRATAVISRGSEVVVTGYDSIILDVEPLNPQP